jgi:hypothetical protein
MPTNTDLVTDLPADFEVFGQAVATSLADLLGGTTGQVLAKATNTNMDFVWTDANPGDITGVTAGTGISGGGTSGTVTVTNSMATAIDAKGDLIVGTGSDAFSRLAVGTNGQVLQADSTAATGLKWATAGGGGKVLQVVQGTTTTSKSITSSTFTDTNLTASITPSSSSSRILILTTQQFDTVQSGSSEQYSGYRLLRDSTSIQNWAPSGYESMGVRASNGGTLWAEIRGVISTQYVDSPATTSSVTYKTQARIFAAGTITLQESSAPASIILLEIGA